VTEGKSCRPRLAVSANGIEAVIGLADHRGADIQRIKKLVEQGHPHPQLWLMPWRMSAAKIFSPLVTAA